MLDPFEQCKAPDVAQCDPSVDAKYNFSKHKMQSVIRVKIHGATYKLPLNFIIFLFYPHKGREKM